MVLIEQTADPDAAAVWLRTREGVIAKQAPRPTSRASGVGMVKIRRTRTIDCVAIGYRNREKGGGVASLILALYEADGTLRPVGHTLRVHRARARGNWSRCGEPAGVRRDGRARPHPLVAGSRLGLVFGLRPGAGLRGLVSSTSAAAASAHARG